MKAESALSKKVDSGFRRNDDGVLQMETWVGLRTFGGHFSKMRYWT